MTDVASREFSCKQGKTIRRAKTSRAREPRPDAVLADKSPVESRLGRLETCSEPSLSPGGPSRGRLGRQEARLEAVSDARRAVRRPFWTPEVSSAGRLGCQQARMQVVARSW